MGRSRKVVLLIVDLLFFLLFGTVLLIYFEVSNLSLDVSHLQEFVRTNFIFMNGIFWFSLIALLMTVILAVVILLLPKSHQYMELKNEQGKLVLNKKAIEGFVRTSLSEADFIDAPKVSVKMLNKVIKVKVTGDIKRTSELITHQKEWSKKMQEDLKRLLGVTQTISTDVRLVNMTKDSNKYSYSKSKSRVE